jgi:benzoate transport
MSVFGTIVVALCVLVNAIDGFDIMALAFASPAIAREWGLSPERTGFLLSSGLVGIGIGALAFAVVADTLGRRPVILVGITLMSVGMIAAALTSSVESLAICRAITGLGIGGMATSGGPLAMEYSAPSRRALSLALVVIGYPIGATLGGMLAVVLLAQWGWRSIFLTGGVISAALLPLLAWRMPESIEFLIDRKPRRALERVNTYRQQQRLSPLASLPDRIVSNARSGLFREFLKAPLLAVTVRLALAYACFMFSFYFILNWATKLITELGLPDSVGVSATALLNFGGIAGGILLGILTTRFSLRALAFAVTLLMAIAIAAFGFLPANVTLISAFALSLGFFMWASSASAYAVFALAFPARIRATGIGIVITVGRIGSVLGPYLAGVLLQGGMGRATLTMLLAVPAAAAAVLLVLRKTS